MFLKHVVLIILRNELSTPPELFHKISSHFQIIVFRTLILGFVFPRHAEIVLRYIN